MVAKVSKCQHNHITLSTAARLVDYSVSGVELSTVENIHDLGVLVDSRLSFRDHINSIVSRGNVRAAQMWRCFMCKDVYNITIKRLLLRMFDRC